MQSHCFVDQKSQPPQPLVRQAMLLLNQTLQPSATRHCQDARFTVRRSVNIVHHPTDNETKRMAFATVVRSPPKMHAYYTIVVVVLSHISQQR
eukprot:m.49996 g.49996  ORF g.49996 m.49996 type:complete len:93 (-) comp11131_c0_seq1:2467-2745(-)